MGGNICKVEGLGGGVSSIAMNRNAMHRNEMTLSLSCSSVASGSLTTQPSPRRRTRRGAYEIQRQWVM